MSKIKTKKLPKLSTIRNKCDALLTPIVKLINPSCLLCGNKTEVAHHHKHKSSSTRLRYELTNLIALCNSCHFSLHQNESYHASRIVEINGLQWFKDLDKMGREIVKADVYFYMANLERLQDIYKSLCNR